MALVYRPGHPAANENGMVDREIAGPRENNFKSAFVMSDTPGYLSVASGKYIDGKRARRDDLKRTGCREVDSSEGPKACRTEKWAKKLNMPHDPNHWRPDIKSYEPNINMRELHERSR